MRMPMMLSLLLNCNRWLPGVTLGLDFYVGQKFHEVLIMTSGPCAGQVKQGSCLQNSSVDLSLFPSRSIDVACNRVQLERRFVRPPWSNRPNMARTGLDTLLWGQVSAGSWWILIVHDIRYGKIRLEIGRGKVARCRAEGPIRCRYWFHLLTMPVGNQQLIKGHMWYVVCIDQQRISTPQIQASSSPRLDTACWCWWNRFQTDQKKFHSKRTLAELHGVHMWPKPIAIQHALRYT
jgi:hypothetical protein